MSRFFRLYEKKRGHRRTGSKAFGNFGEALFFGIFFAVGCLAFALMFGRFVWPEWRANRQFAAARCVVLDKQVHEVTATTSEPATYLPEIHIRYELEGRTYETHTYDVTRAYSADRAAVEAIVAGFDVGGEYPCWVDPIDPHHAVLVRGYSGWLYLLLLIPLSFITIGGGGLVYTFMHWNTSAERRALLQQRAAQIDLFDMDETDRNFPTVPANANLTNSPGTTLAYRLPVATAAVWRLFAMAMAALLWNAIVAIFVVMAVRSHTSGEPDWILTAFIIPFSIAGLGLIVYFVRQFLIATSVGPTRIEISHHPLEPGGQYEVLLTQTGRMTINSLELWLACDEKASYHQGTDTRTETRGVYRQRCFVQEEFQTQQGMPFESHCQIQVPRDAMHSFQSNHNEVSWKLVVKGNVAGRREYERVFPLVVNPVVNGQDQHAPTVFKAPA